MAHLMTFKEFNLRGDRSQQATGKNAEQSETLSWQSGGGGHMWLDGEESDDVSV